MTDSARARKLSERITQIVAEMLERRIKDPRLGFITVTDTRVTGDLREATVYYTVYGSEQDAVATAAALASATGVIRSEVGRQTGLKHTPSIAFRADSLPEGANRIEELVTRARQADAELAAARDGAEPAGDPEPYRTGAGEGAGETEEESPLVAASGLVIVDKSPGMTSHDVVARIRRLAGTRRVGHAGTLDPMATGALVLGVEKATRLLGHLALTEKEYVGTIRLGLSTVTDDADGEIVTPPLAPGGTASGITEHALRGALAAFTGQVSQVPPKVSAIKVNGRRAYHLTRSGAAPELHARTVTISRLELTGSRPVGDLLDVDVEVTCSSGTYIRSIARDLGAALGVGGHLTALRRTRVGPYRIGQARTLEQLAEAFDLIPLDQAARAAFRWLELSAQEAWLARHGGRLPGIDARRLQEPAEAAQPILGADRPVAAFGPDGHLIALLSEHVGEMQPVTVFAT